MTSVVALDVGGTTMKGAVVGPGYDLRVVERRPTGRAQGPDAVVAAILDFAGHLVTLADHSPAAVGVAVPGIVDDATGTAVYSANLAWRDVPMRRLLTDRLGLPVVVAHDVRTGGVGEATLGAGRDAGDFLFLPIGTGVSAALMLGGRPYSGPTGATGELGHIIVRPGGTRCLCGQHGCLEAYASAAAISHHYTQATTTIPQRTAPNASPQDRHAVPDGTTRPAASTTHDFGRRAPSPGTSTSAASTTADVVVPAQEVVRRALAGDSVAERIWDEALDALADGLHAATMVIDPELIVVGGGLAQSGDLLLVPLAERLAARFTFRSAPRLAAAELGDQAAMLGAAVLAWRAAGR
jgi:glucokinase